VHNIRQRCADADTSADETSVRKHLVNTVTDAILDVLANTDAP